MIKKFQTVEQIESDFGNIKAISVSATTYQNLPKDIYVTGGTFSSGTAIFTNSTGGTFSVSGFGTGSGGGNGTVTNVSALSLGTIGTDVSSSVTNPTTTPLITLNLPSSSAINRGLLTPTDWNIFNNKQNALGFTPENIANKDQNNGYAGLDSTGKINPLQLPALAITDTFVVGSESAMLALVAEVGDIAVRTDLNKSFILRVAGASTLANWQELLTPTDSVQSVFGRQGVVVAQSGDYNTSQVTENTNLYFTNLRAISAPLTGYAPAPGAVASTDNVLQAFNKVNGNVALKQDNILAGTTAQYYRGDKTFQTLNSTVVPEGTNLYYTNARGIGSLLTGYVSGAGTVASTDSILQAIQKLNGNDGLKVDKTITISTTAPLTGGGDLSANRTISIPAATNSVNGYLTALDRTNFQTAFDNRITSLTTVGTSGPATLVGNVLNIPNYATGGGGGGGITNSGTIGTLPKTTTGGNLIDSIVKESGDTVTIGRLTISDTVVDFENGLITPFVSLLTPGTPWVTQSVVVRSGTFAAKSANIGNSTSSSMEYTNESLSSITFSCWYKVSSEPGYDKLRIFIEGGAIIVNDVSGEVDWTQMTTNILPNEKIVIRYTKDGSSTSGTDAAYIDDVFISNAVNKTGELIVNTKITTSTISASNYIGLPQINQPIIKSGSDIFGNTYRTDNSANVNGNNVIAFGRSAGGGGSSDDNRILIGEGAGNNSTSVYQSIFIGRQTGVNADGSYSSVFIGQRAGGESLRGPFNSFMSNFIGFKAGDGARSSYSNLIGFKAGHYTNTVNDIGNNNIIIGTSISLPSAATNSINIGGVLFGSGTYFDTDENSAPSIVPTVGGKIGINVVAPTANLDIAASTTAQALMRLRVGPAPTAPNDGDVWLESNTTTGLKIRIAGVTRTITLT